MEHDVSHDRVGRLQVLAQLPRKMIIVYGLDNVAEFLLHELCQPLCFNWSKAAYFVNNPDFNCMKGIAGWTQNHAYKADNIWHNAEKFSSHMKDAHFNQKVRSCARCSIVPEKHEDVAQELAHSLEINNYGYHIIPIKHNNHGILVYENNNQATHATHKTDIENALSLFAFCPIF